MRCLEKNKRLITYRNLEGTKPVIDDLGYDTLEVEKTYSTPKEIRVNYSVNMGQIETNTFGNFTDYDRVIVMCSVPPFKEGDLLNLNGVEYEVKKIADSLNSYSIAIKELI